MRSSLRLVLLAPIACLATGDGLSAQQPELHFDWAHVATGGSIAEARGTAAFRTGGVAIAGGFEGSLELGAGSAGETRLSSDGKADVVVARYDASGNFEWAERAGGTELDCGVAVAALANGLTLVAAIAGPAPTTFGAGGPVEVTFAFPDPAQFFTVLALYERDGALRWAKAAGGGQQGASQVTDLHADADGSSLLCGFIQDAPVTFGLGEAEETVLVPDAIDAFVSRHAANGTLEWARSITGPDSIVARGVAVAADGSIYVAGNFRGQATFAKDEPQETVLTERGAGGDIFVARYAADGSLLWARAAGDPGRDQGTKLATTIDGGVLLLGSIEGTATFNPGEADELTLAAGSDRDAFLVRYGADGSLRWAQRWGGSGADQTDAHDVTVTSSGHAVVSGVFHNSVTFDPGTANETVLAGIDAEVYLAVFDGSGQWLDATSAGGPADDVAFDLSLGPVIAAGSIGGSRGRGSRARDLSLQSTRFRGGANASSEIAVYLSGRFQSTATFGAGEPTETILDTAGSDWALFVARWRLR